MTDSVTPIITFNDVDVGFLSNYYRCTVRVLLGHGQDYNFTSVEAAYQALKFRRNKGIFSKIYSAKTVLEALEISYENYQHSNPNWKEKSVEVMSALLREKFKNDTQLKDKLLATGEAQLVHHSIDDFWSFNPETKTGKNTLGKILMEIRTYMKISRQSYDI